jgi:hypothetical protein
MTTRDRWAIALITLLLCASSYTVAKWGETRNRLEQCELSHAKTLPEKGH